MRLWLSAAVAILLLLALGYLDWSLQGSKAASPEYYPVTAALSTVSACVVVAWLARRGVRPVYQVILGALTWYGVDLVIRIVFLFFEPFD